MISRFASLLLLSGSLLSAQAAEYKKWDCQQTDSYPYCTHVQSESAPDGGAWPVMCFLPGSGARGSLDQASSLAGYDGHGKLVSEYLGGNTDEVHSQAAEQFLTVVPIQADGTRHFDPDKIASIIDEVKQNFNVDTSRIYISGYSMGARGTHRSLTFHPEIWAAGGPSAGSAEDSNADTLQQEYAPQDFNKLQNEVDIPVWSFAGQNDNTAGVDGSEATEKEVKSLGGQEYKLTVVPGADHSDMNIKPWTDYDLLSWFLQQTKDGSSSSGAVSSAGAGASATASGVASSSAPPVATPTGTSSSGSGSGSSGSGSDSDSGDDEDCDEDEDEGEDEDCDEDNGDDDEDCDEDEDEGEDEDCEDDGGSDSSSSSGSGQASGSGQSDSNSSNSSGSGQASGSGQSSSSSGSGQATGSGQSDTNYGSGSGSGQASGSGQSDTNYGNSSGTSTASGAASSSSASSDEDCDNSRLARLRRRAASPEAPHLMERQVHHHVFSHSKRNWEVPLDASMQHIAARQASSQDKAHRRALARRSALAHSHNSLGRRAHGRHGMSRVVRR